LKHLLKDGKMLVVAGAYIGLLERNRLEER
jgi:hypothetical protein